MLNHTRDFFAAGSFNPRDVTEPRYSKRALDYAFLRPDVHISRQDLCVFVRHEGSSLRLALTKGLEFLLNRLRD
jgi:hypothetical protein